MDARPDNIPGYPHGTAQAEWFHVTVALQSDIAPVLRREIPSRPFPAAMV